MYISHAQSLLTEKGASSITIKALGRAINKAITIAEILKRRVPGLHQVMGDRQSVYLMFDADGQAWPWENEEIERGIQKLTTWPLTASALPFPAYRIAFGFA